MAVLEGTQRRIQGLDKLEHQNSNASQAVNQCGEGCMSACTKLPQYWEGCLRKAMVANPGFSGRNPTVRDETGGLQTHGLRWNEEPAAHTERVHVGNSAPKTARAVFSPDPQAVS